MRGRPIVLIAIVGALAGFLAGLFGVGGGILIVPGLVLVAHMGQRLAHGTSLAAVLPISVSSLVTYAVHDNVDWTVAGLLGLGSVVGVVIGTAYLHVADPRTLRLLFSGILIASAIRLFIPVDSDGRIALSVIGAIAVVVIGVASGALAGVLGVGGGVIMVPAMILAFSIAPVVAKGTSAAAIIPAALIGTLRNRTNGNTDLRTATVVGLSGIVTAVAGGIVSDHLDDDVAVALFATLLLTVAIRMLWELRRERVQVPSDA